MSPTMPPPKPHQLDRSRRGAPFPRRVVRPAQAASVFAAGSGALRKPRPPGRRERLPCAPHINVETTNSLPPGGDVLREVPMTPRSTTRNSSVGRFDAKRGHTQLYHGSAGDGTSEADLVAGFFQSAHTAPHGTTPHTHPPVRPQLRIVSRSARPMRPRKCLRSFLLFPIGRLVETRTELMKYFPNRFFDLLAETCSPGNRQMDSLHPFARADAESVFLL